MCPICHSYHTELPDCLVPYKHYEAEVISGVLDEVVRPENLDSEDYPSFSTMRRWMQWFVENLTRIEGYLRTAGFHLLACGRDILFQKFPCSMQSVKSIQTGWNVSCVWSITTADFWFRSAGKAMHLLWFVWRTACWYSCLKRRQLYYEYRKNSCNTAMAGSGSAPPLSTDFAALTYLKIKAKLLLFLYMNSALIFVLRLIALLSSALIRIRQ